MKGSYRATAAAALALALAACAPQQSGDVYSSANALTASEVQFGTITGSRNVELQNMGQADQAIGAVLGGVAGAALGQNVGKGTGRVLATGALATAGAAAGNQAGKYVGRAQSIEWFVRLDDGREISVVQGEPVFGVGQRVRVISGGGQTRLAA
jgi:outer membrane lipoprotein SlyB